MVSNIRTKNNSVCGGPTDTRDSMVTLYVSRTHVQRDIAYNLLIFPTPLSSNISDKKYKKDYPKTYDLEKDSNSAS